MYVLSLFIDSKYCTDDNLQEKMWNFRSQGDFDFPFWGPFGNVINV